MRLTLAQLEAFRRVAQLGSYRAAARSLALSQPAVSMRMRDLQLIVGVSLLERRGKRLALTTAGASVLEYADNMLEIAGRISGGHVQTDPVQVGLRLGAPDSFAQVCIPRLLEVIEEHYPELRVFLTIDSSHVLQCMMMNGELDIAFIVEASSESGLHSELLGVLEHIWVASRAVKVPRRSICPVDLAEHHIFTHSPPSQLFSLVERWFAEEGLRPPRISTCNNLSVVAHLITKAAGVGILPRPLVRSKLRAGDLRQLAAQPEVESQRFFAVYPTANRESGIPAVLEAVRATVSRTHFLRH